MGEEDVDWFEKTVRHTVYDEAGEDWEALVSDNPQWVNFMMDPEDLMEPHMGDDADIPDYPNVYEEVKR